MSHALAVLAALPLHHLYLDGLAVLVLAALFWRLNLSGWALHANRTRAMRWRIRCHLRPGNGFASLAELAVQWSRLTAAQRGGRARPGLSWPPAPPGPPAAPRAPPRPRPARQAGVRLHGGELAHAQPAPQGQDRRTRGVGPQLARRCDQHQHPRRRVRGTPRGPGTAADRSMCSTRPGSGTSRPRSAGTSWPVARTRPRRSPGPTRLSAPASGARGTWRSGRTKRPLPWPRCCMPPRSRGARTCWTSGPGATARETPSQGQPWPTTRGLGRPPGRIR